MLRRLSSAGEMPRLAAAGPLVSGAELDFDGSVTITSTGQIVWHNPAIIQNTSTLSFAPLAGTSVSELNLDRSLQPAGPAGTFAPLPNFEVLAAQPTTNFTLVAINVCSGSLCQPLAGPNSPFNFIEVPDGLGGTNTTVLLSMFGTATDPVLNPGQTFTWTGSFSADFPHQTAAQILTQLASTGSIDA